jgi:hypothetical protein
MQFNLTWFGIAIYRGKEKLKTVSLNENSTIRVKRKSKIPSLINRPAFSQKRIQKQKSNSNETTVRFVLYG